LITIFAIALSLIAIPTTSAQSSKSTYAYIGAVPNPVGVNQETVIHFGITENLPNATDAFTGLKVKVTKPDTTVETLGPFSTDSMGGASTVYVPTTAGNYSLQATFPSQTVSGGTYLASSSRVITLVVQAEPREYYPANPLPTEYWTRPVDGQNSAWYWLGGMTNEVARNDEGPLSPHILWVKPFGIGGLTGGGVGMGDRPASENGDAYDGKWSTRSIVGGIIFSIMDTVVSPTVTIATDIRTGEELWRKTGFSYTFGQEYFYQTNGQHRFMALLWRSVTGGAGGQAGTVYSAYDVWTLEWVYNITNIPSGTRTTGPSGEILLYTLSLTGGYMLLWNQTWALEQARATSNAWGVDRLSINATAIGYQYNWTVPLTLYGSAREYRWGDRVLGTYESGNRTDMWAFSLESPDTKQRKLLYNQTTIYTLATVDPSLRLPLSATPTFRLLGDSPEDSAHLHWQADLRKYWAYSYATGEELWKSEDFPETKDGEFYLNQYGRRTLTWENGHASLYISGYSGMVYAYNATKGLIWVYHVVDPYTEIMWNNDWGETRAEYVTQDGRIYCGHEEHSPNQPMPRGAPFVCINATTGETIWRSNGLFRQTGWGGRQIIGESTILTQDTYDQQMYAIAKGPSAMTVTAPDKAVPFGSTAIIRGTVTDVSPGTNSPRIQLRFPHGVPAVADESMSDWMCYVYKQFARPANAVGVSVTVAVLDPQGTFKEIGKTTSDATGFFSFKFVPEVAGIYTVYAKFEGSNSYYGSSAESALFVEEAPIATPAPSPTPVPMSEAYFVPAITGMIVGFVVVGVLLALLLLRKH
jgi:hypothetical protein